MLGQVDVLSINCPATPETERFLNADRIAMMKDGAIVLNSARGSIIVDDALIAALESGKLAAAGLDVFDGEPKLDPRYLTLENTFLMPHVGSATLETRNAMGFRALDNLDAIFADAEPGDRIAQHPGRCPPYGSSFRTNEVDPRNSLVIPTPFVWHDTCGPFRHIKA